MIIIEGPDAAGKTTLVKWIRENTSMGVMKPYYPKVNQLSYYLHSPSHYGGHFLERYYLSEIVYPRFKKNRVPLEDWKQFIIEAALMPYAPVILYLRPEKETIVENFKARGDDYVSEDEIDLMLAEYDWAINRSHIPVVRFDFKKDNMEETIEKAMSLHIEREYDASNMKYFLSSGNSVDPDGIMFIGEDPSDKAVGEGYIRAFISDSGCSAFLHEVLYEAGVYDKEMPYFTNWKKGLDNDKDRLDVLKNEIEYLKPRKIILLGKNPLIESQIPLVHSIEHPAYVKRFSGKEYKWYINKIKDAVSDCPTIPK
jgi:hypothetical protein